MTNTHFITNGVLYKQINGLATGASTSGFAAEACRAMNTFNSPPSIWRSVDSTFVKIRKKYVMKFMEYLHPQIEFTSET